MSAHRNKERGSIVVVAMLILVALISLGGLTTLSVQGGLASAGHDRFRSIALYAAESGAAVGMDYLRREINESTGWSHLVQPVILSDSDPYDNLTGNPFTPTDLPGNSRLPGTPGNPFSPELRAWYKVEIVNNREDSGYETGEDSDKRVILRVTGYGPNGTVAQIEWDVKASQHIGLGRACPTYAQGNIDADGAGLNECMGTVSSDVATYSINNP